MILKAKVERFCPYCQKNIKWDIYHNGDGKQFVVNLKSRLRAMALHREICAMWYVEKQTLGVKP